MNSENNNPNEPTLAILSKLIDKLVNENKEIINILTKLQEQRILSEQLKHVNVPDSNKNNSPYPHPDIPDKKDIKWPFDIPTVPKETEIKDPMYPYGPTSDISQKTSAEKEFAALPSTTNINSVS